MVLIGTGDVDDATMLILEKISNYLLIVKKLRGLGIDFLAWKCIRRLKNGDFKSFFEDSKCIDENFRRQSFKRRREQAWQSFFLLLGSNVQRFSNNDIKTLVEEMVTVINDLNESEKLILQLIKASSKFTLEKIKLENCTKQCEIEYGNHTKFIDLLGFVSPASLAGILLGLGVPPVLILLISLVVFGVSFVILSKYKEKRRKSYKDCNEECFKESSVVRLSERIDYLVNRLNYLVDKISRLLGVNSSSAIMERVAYSGYRT
jgi:hypothetical protein